MSRPWLRGRDPYLPDADERARQDTAFREIKGPNLELFPTVGLKKTGEHIRVNFGQAPFVFDIDGLMKAS